MSWQRVGIGKGASPLMPVPALDIVELLESLPERRIRAMILSALGSLEVGGKATVQLNTRLVAKTFSKTLVEMGSRARCYTFVITEEGHIDITRTE